MYLLSRSLTFGSGFLQNCVLLSILLSAAFVNVVTAIPIDVNDSKPEANDSEPNYKVQEAQKCQSTLSSDIYS
ncbi:hypothetical protein FB446DRAFT_743458 [Lentinula raphanica]|nr:hypothetical protein FB446DRAFT_743458 [Lentinula raphanica]